MSRQHKYVSLKMFLTNAVFAVSLYVFPALFEHIAKKNLQDTQKHTTFAAFNDVIILIR